MTLPERIFSISSAQEFNALALEIFRYQYENNAVYNTFCSYLKRSPENVKMIEDIPFLPISFFKTHQLKTGTFEPEITFLSSGTTGSVQSKHLVKDLALYEQSFVKGFTHFYGAIEDHCVIGLLPSYLEREGSSLIYMVDKMIGLSNNEKSGFFSQK